MNLISAFVGLLTAASTFAATGATLSSSNIDTRTTLYEMVFADQTFAGAFNQRSDLLQFNGDIGDSGIFSVTGFAPGATISVLPGAGMAITDLQPANASGVIFYTATVVGTSDLTLTQSWVNRGTLTTGVTSGGLHYLDFFARNSGFLRTGGVFDFSVSIPGNWSTFGTSSGQVELLGVNSEFSITQSFIYDAVSNRTMFQAVDSNYTQVTSDVHFVLYGQAVPEPASAAMLVVGAALIGLRHRSRQRSGVGCCT